MTTSENALHKTSETLPEVVQIENDRGQLREYETVASRLLRFREAHPEYALLTNIIVCNEERVMIRAEVAMTYEDGGVLKTLVLATGHAEEWRGSNDINMTSCVENCETSAIGRALAAFGFLSKASFGSADEVATAIKKQKDLKPLQAGAVGLLQQAAQKGMKELEATWKQKLSPEEREACRGIITEMKRIASQVTEDA